MASQKKVFYPLIRFAIITFFLYDAMRKWAHHTAEGTRIFGNNYTAVATLIEEHIGLPKSVLMSLIGWIDFGVLVRVIASFQFVVALDFFMEPKKMVGFLIAFVLFQMVMDHNPFIVHYQKEKTRAWRQIQTDVGLLTALMMV